MKKFRVMVAVMAMAMAMLSFTGCPSSTGPGVDGTLTFVSNALSENSTDNDYYEYWAGSVVGWNNVPFIIYRDGYIDYMPNYRGPVDVNNDGYPAFDAYIEKILRANNDYLVHNGSGLYFIRAPKYVFIGRNRKNSPLTHDTFLIVLNLKVESENRCWEKCETPDGRIFWINSNCSTGEQVFYDKDRRTIIKEPNDWWPVDDYDEEYYNVVKWAYTTVPYVMYY